MKCASCILKRKERTRPMPKDTELTMYVISDSVGATASNIARAALAQFSQMKYDLKIFSFIREEDQLQTILERAQKKNAVILHTFVNKEMVDLLHSYCNTNALTCYDILNPIITEISQRTNQKPEQHAGAMHKLDDHYFNRIGAMEFAVKYDDGKDPKGFLEADILILGISRTSKTPLSIYLANQNYKVANLPLMPENDLPDELWEVDPKKIVGLTNDEEVLKNIRRERMISYGLSPDTHYSSSERIQKEIAFAEDLYERLGCQIINVASKSIEETAAIIMNSLEK